MIRKQIKLYGNERLQPRPAALLVQEACKYTSQIVIEQGGKTANAKSMMGILSLNAPTNNMMALVVDGSDELTAMEALMPLLDKLFTQIA